MKNKHSLEPGIYFNLEESLYFADTALSRSDLVNLLDTPNTYWKNSWMNPHRKPARTNDGMEYGSAFDCMLFTPEEFSKRYQVVPVDPHSPHKKRITYDDYFKIIESIKVLKKGEDSNLFLSGGMPQVTLVFDFAGFRFRVRIDWFTPVLSTDFKTTFSLDEWHLKRAFQRYGYDIQLWLYRLARVQFKSQFLAGEASVFGEVEKKFFNRFMEDENNGFCFVFQRSTEPYPFKPLLPEDDTEQAGAVRAEKALKIYTYYMAKYSTAEWPVCEGKMKSFSMYYGEGE